MGTLAMRGPGCWRTWHVGRLNRPSLSRPSVRLRAQPARSATQRSPRDPPALGRTASDGPLGPRHRRIVSLALRRLGGQRIVGGATERPRRAGARVRWCRAMLPTARRRSACGVCGPCPCSPLRRTNRPPHHRPATRPNKRRKEICVVSKTWRREWEVWEREETLCEDDT